MDKLNRSDLLKKSALAVAGLAATNFFSCSTDEIESFFQKHFKELSHDELNTVLKRIENENKSKFGQTGTVETTPAMDGVQFAYGLDISRCIGCRRCVYACVKENNQSRDPAIHWIRVLEFEKETGVDFSEADPYYCSSDSIHDQEAKEKSENSPKYSQSKDQSLSEKQKDILKKPDLQYPLYNNKAGKDSECAVPRKGFFYVPIACQQCENPPCVKVCPVKATWKEPDGIVVIDYNWCIGCRYCVAACPYGARHFNWSEPVLPNGEFNPDQHYLGNRPRPKGVVENCTFCIQRTRKGLYPACVEVCPVGARKFGNLLDPDSEIRAIMDHKRVFILKNELKTKPRFFYFYGV